MNSVFRLRNCFLAGGSLAVLALLILTDPDAGYFAGILPFGSTTLVWLISLARGIVAVAFAHYSRKALFDYKEADLANILRNSLKTSTGSGLAFLGICIVLVGLLMVFSSKG